MSSPDATSRFANPPGIFAALGDATRLQLVRRLNDGRAKSISQLTEGLGVTRQAVTKHLRVLEEAGLVRSSRTGRENRFIFVPDPVEKARDYLDDISADWDAALARLQAHVES